MKIYLKKSDYEKILEYAVSELPNEACGLIAGIIRNDGEEEIRNIEKVYLLTNTDHSNEHFSLDPKEQLQSIKDMRENGLTPLGNWHSHPESPSRSSQEDIRLAFDKNANYLILSLMDRSNPVLNSFHVENGESTKEELIFID
ncbi:MAG: M67 family metallopeptidase [Clostridiales bacterium]|nr:M67 family metallopeptidase [Clostridiales bacterium]